MIIETVKKEQKMKVFTWQMSARNECGEIVFANTTDSGRGYRQSWYKTEEAARKAMNRWAEWWESKGYTEIKWTLYSSIKGIGIIETNV